MILKFYKKVILFFLTTISTLLFLFFGTGAIDHQINKNIYQADKVAILGNSHAKTAINDSILTNNSNVSYTNYGVNGQSMFWSIVAGRKLYHQGVRNFIIELNNGSYTSGWKTTDKPRGSREFYNRHYITFSEWKSLYKQDVLFTIRMFSYLHLPTKKISGGYEKLTKEFSNQIVKENVSVLKEDTINIDFDDAMLHEFIKSHPDATFFILRVPQHRNFYQRISPQLEKKFQNKIAHFSRHSNCDVIDFGHTFNNDSLFADIGHMNFKGSHQFSYQLLDSLKIMTGK